MDIIFLNNVVASFCQNRRFANLCSSLKLFFVSLSLSEAADVNMEPNLAGTHVLNASGIITSIA